MVAMGSGGVPSTPHLAWVLVLLGGLRELAAPQEVPLRLSDGPHRCAGRLEVFHQNQWGTVCDDHWGLEETRVVCRQLGCGAGGSVPSAGHFRAGSGPIWLDNVNCTGTERDLSSCGSGGWGQNNCHHGEDVGVVCSAPVTTRGSPDIRVVDGPDRCSGRVEVFHDHQWGTICDDDWGFPEASVVCRQLGCGGPLSAYGAAHFGQGSGPIWLDNVDCAGTEVALSQCPSRPWGLNNCDHREDAGVVCRGPTPEPGVPLRLQNGPNRCAGRVEVLHLQQWGTICDRGWDLEEAAVVCRQLGCGAAILAPGSAHFGQGSGRVWLAEVNCTGSEGDLAECRAGPWGLNDCHHREDASVVCSDADATRGLRLANGSTSCVGRVEIFHDHKWGTICDDTWDLHDATVVCRQLGCRAALAAPGAGRFGPGPDPIWLDGVHCEGNEGSLEECELGNWGEHNCGHNEDAGVVCAGTNPLEVRVQDGPGPCVGRVQVLYNSSWHGVCGDGWSLLEAEVLCRQLGCGAALSAPTQLQAQPGGSQEGPGLLEGLSCQGTESFLLECQQGEVGLGSCRQGWEAAVVCTQPQELAQSCSVLGGLLGLGAALCGTLLVLYLWTRCRRGLGGSSDQPLTQKAEDPEMSPEP